VLLALLVAGGVLFGHLNSQRFVLICDTDRAVAQRGRSFPPWGEQPLTGPRWKPIVLLLASECREREASSEEELSGWYLSILIEQATARLTARKIVDVDVAAAQLEQALGLSRSPQRRDQRHEIDRLLGDVEYWRAVATLRSASESMIEAAKQFEEAAVRNPRHVGDSAARAVQIRKLMEELSGQADALQGAPAERTGAASASAPPSPPTSAAPSTASRTVPVVVDAPAAPDAGARNPDAGARNPDAGARNPDAGARNPDAGARNPDAGARNPDAGARDPDAGVAAPDARIPSPSGGVLL
jgi:hypothetical protein